MDKDKEKEKPDRGVGLSQPRKLLLQAIAAAAGIAALLFASRYADRAHLAALVEWVEGHRARGAFALAALHVTCTICLVPTALVAAAIGALYGALYGVALVWAASVVGETVAFCLGRYLLRASVVRAAASWPMWAALEVALAEDGWKLVLLLRLCPLSPFTLLNYALGASALPFSHFFWPSVVGIAPGIFLFVYAGALAGDLAELGGGSGGGGSGSGGLLAAAPPGMRAAFYVFSAVTGLAVLVGSAVYTKRALARALYARLGPGAAGGGGGGGAAAADAEMGCRPLARLGSGEDRGGRQQGGSGAALPLAQLLEVRPGMAQRSRSMVPSAAPPPPPALARPLKSPLRDPPAQQQHQQQQHQQQNAAAAGDGGGLAPADSRLLVDAPAAHLRGTVTLPAP